MECFTILVDIMSHKKRSFKVEWLTSINKIVSHEHKLFMLDSIIAQVKKVRTVYGDMIEYPKVSPATTTECYQ